MSVAGLRRRGIEHRRPSPDGESPSGLDDGTRSVGSGGTEVAARGVRRCTREKCYCHDGTGFAGLQSTSVIASSVFTSGHPHWSQQESAHAPAVACSPRGAESLNRAQSSGDRKRPRRSMLSVSGANRRHRKIKHPTRSTRTRRAFRPELLFHRVVNAAAPTPRSFHVGRSSLLCGALGAEVSRHKTTGPRCPAPSPHS
jgi:hypothetical protein